MRSVTRGIETPKESAACFAGGTAKKQKAMQGERVLVGDLELKIYAGPGFSA